jgi:hypothetical protein
VNSNSNSKGRSNVDAAKGKVQSAAFSKKEVRQSKKRKIEDVSEKEEGEFTGTDSGKEGNERRGRTPKRSKVVNTRSRKRHQ